MSEEVGLVYKSRIPTLTDDATIVEALSVYHYGTPNWSGQPIPDQSIEGHFRTINISIDEITTQLSGISGDYVNLVSQSGNPNIITGESTSTVPVTIRATGTPTVPLQQWQNSSSLNVGSISAGGNMNIAGYLTVGNTTQATTTGISIVLANPAHKGLVIKASGTPTVNIQEWQNSSGVAVSWVDKEGKIYSDGSEVSGGPGSFFLMGA